MTRNDLDLFFSREYENDINEHILEYDYDIPFSSIKEYISNVCSISFFDIVNYIIEQYPIMKLEKSDFMQFSDPKDATTHLCAVFKELNGQGMQAYELGTKLLEKGKKHEAYRKYGEGNGKAGSALGLLSNYSNTYFLASLGYVFLDLNEHEQIQLLSRLIVRLPEYRQLFVEIEKNGYLELREYMNYFPESTYVRRRSTFKNLLRMMNEADPVFFQYYIDRIHIQ